MPLCAAEERSSLTYPWERREFIYRRNEECRKAPIEWFVHSNNGERSIARKVTFKIGTDDAQLGRVVVVWEERKGIGSKARSAPRAILERYGRRFALWVGFELAYFGSSRIRAPIPF